MGNEFCLYSVVAQGVGLHYELEFSQTRANWNWARSVYENRAQGGLGERMGEDGENGGAEIISRKSEFSASPAAEKFPLAKKSKNCYHLDNGRLQAYHVGCNLQCLLSLVRKKKITFHFQLIWNKFTSRFKVCLLYHRRYGTFARQVCAKTSRK